MRRPDGRAAVNTLANAYSDVRDSTQAVQMYHPALGRDPGNGRLLANLAMQYSTMGRHAAFDSVMTLMASRNASFPTAGPRFNELWNRRDYDRAERLARAEADTARPRSALDARDGLITLAVLHGRLRDAEREFAQVNDAKVRVRGDTASSCIVAYFRAMLDDELRGDAPRALATLDSTSRAIPIASVPVSRDQSMWLALGYARLGAVAKAREVLNQHEARLHSLERRQNFVFAVRVLGAIALAEGKSDSAVAYFRRGDSARAYLTKYVEMTGNGRFGADRFYLAPALFRLGELYESAGDAKHATEYYGRFVDLWANADPDLQPRVAEARKRMDHLSHATR